MNTDFNDEFDTSGVLKQTLLTLVVNPDNKSTRRKSQLIGPWLQISHQLTQKRKKATQYEKSSVEFKRTHFTVIEPKVTIQDLKKYQTRQLEPKRQMKQSLSEITCKGQKLNRLLKNMYRKNTNIHVNNRKSKEKSNHSTITLKQYYQTLDIKNNTYGMQNTKTFCPQVIKSYERPKTNMKQKISQGLYTNRVKHQSRRKSESLLGFGSDSCTTKQCLITPRKKLTRKPIYN